ncbi:hypothetical protein LOTGIDRAFT_160494 [Lottia gigantea]|uniref:Uncharacterized protein n=1 Tax=Lottia gigantea TaxID=225164 RepID=V4AET4_LOTGI|nr:hypothetical protein LOTGIDRAFT_160494 [Lottia gigantea]ESO95362.1 hypothetical protein LOTGIDRAFT_160494 [Lottia gigantea]
MPSADHKSSKTSNGKRGSLTGEKSRKTSPKKKRKSSKKSTSKSESCQNKEDILEVEGLSFPKEGDDSDSSTNKTPLLPKLSSSDVTVNSESTGRVISSNSIGTNSPGTRQIDPSQSQTKSDSSSTTLENLSSKLSNISLKSKSSKSKTKSGSSKKENSAKNPNRKTSDVNSSKSIVMPNIVETPSHPAPVINESIRWENELDTLDSERERIHIYKINRRKRYLAAAQDKGLGWVKQYGVNGFPINDECGLLDSSRRELAVIPDYTSAQVVRNSQSHGIVNGEGKAVSCGY